MPHKQHTKPTKEIVLKTLKSASSLTEAKKLLGLTDQTLMSVAIIDSDIRVAYNACRERGKLKRRTNATSISKPNATAELLAAVARLGTGDSVSSVLEAIGRTNRLIADGNVLSLQILDALRALSPPVFNVVPPFVSPAPGSVNGA